MTATLSRPVADRAPGGGVPARRALVRWAVRMFRREWRQQILVMVLLSLAVAAAVFGCTAGNEVPSPGNATLGSAGQALNLNISSRQALRTDLAAAGRVFGSYDAIEHRNVPLPGTASTVDYRTQNPHGVFGHSMLRLRQGSYPAGAGEAAITTGLATELHAHLGDPITLDGRARTITGIVENPLQFSDQFVLVSPAGADQPTTLSLLVKATAETIHAYGLAVHTPTDRHEMGSTGQVTADIFMLAMTTALLLLVCLVAAAGFAVVAQRRLRQLGMVAAIGATPRQLRLALLVDGALVGVIGAVFGGILGVVSWVVLAPLLENAAGHRLDRLGVPWLVVIIAVLLAIVMATGAAWWPSRAISRVPVVLALSGRPPKPRPAHRSALLGVALLVAGVACLMLAHTSRPPLIIAGTFGTGLGILFVSSPAIRVLAAVGSRAPLAIRLPLRDLVRYQARSGTALAAISLALGIAVVVIGVTAQAKTTATTGNLSDRQILITLGGSDGGNVLPVHTAAQQQALAAQAGRIAGLLDHPETIPLTMPDAPGMPPPPEGGQMVPAFGIPVSEGGRSGYQVAPLYVATPRLLRFLGIAPATVAASTDLLATRSGGLLNPASRQSPGGRLQRIKPTGYTSLPNALLTTGALARNHWTALQAGWLIQSAHPLTTAQLGSARDLAVQSGLLLETRDKQASIQTIQSAATAAGLLLALAVLAMTVGLIRTETADELRTLTATGATSTIRRSLAAATAGALALLGTILGTAGACVGLAAAATDHLHILTRLPVPNLAIIVIGVPLTAVAAAWLLGGGRRSASP
jgi:putative ABC transport system permease protein